MPTALRGHGFWEGMPTQKPWHGMAQPVASYNTLMSTFILAEQLHGDTRAHPWDVAVLPFGATEPHNLHMPYGTDTLQVEEIGRRACEFATNAKAKVILLPALPFGVNTNHLKVPGGRDLQPDADDPAGDLDRPDRRPEPAGRGKSYCCSMATAATT